MNPYASRPRPAAFAACLTLLIVPSLFAQPARRPARAANALSREAVMRRTSMWDPAAREAIAFMTQKYGAPMAVTETMAIWGPTGPWMRTTISSTSTPHAFPAPHPDVMEQVIAYRVPPAMADELMMYDGSVTLDRTQGHMAARCDKEAANFLALNLADEIARGRRTVEDARAKYGEQIMALKAGRPAPYTERLLFTPPASGAADSDRPLVAPAGGE